MAGQPDAALVVSAGDVVGGMKKPRPILRYHGGKKQSRAAAPKAGAAASKPTEPKPELIGQGPILDERLLLPQKVCALAFGISVEALKKWRVKPRKRTGRVALYYLADLIALRLERVDRGEAELSRERARLAKLQTDKVQIELDILRGELVPADEILAAWEPIAGATRTKVLGIKSKAKTAMPELNDDQLATLDGICRGALEDIANGGIPRRAGKRQAARS